MAEKRAAVKDAEFKAGVLKAHKEGWDNRQAAQYLGMEEATFAIRLTTLRKLARANEPDMVPMLTLKRSPRTGGGTGRKAAPYRSLASVLAAMDAQVPAETAVEPAAEAAVEPAVVTEPETPVAE